jgi:hypothetical protein
VAQAGTAGRPIEATLDDMYVPLRLGEGYDLRELRKEHVLMPQNLRRLKQPLAIRGPAGSGKTTWMRWMFRRLLHDEKTLPLSCPRGFFVGWRMSTPSSMKACKPESCSS